MKQKRKPECAFFIRPAYGTILARLSKILVAVIVFSAFLVVLVACSDDTKLSGTYKGRIAITSCTYVFSEDGTVELTMESGGLDPKTIKGRYQIIDRNTIEFKYTWDNRDYDNIASFSRKGPSLFMDGIEYRRVPPG
ncbi:MAG: hypothetical protein FWF91_03225 [Coriobacteriia bacterium]|nr:hypothetical protein [Coriobacteriia bacterium]